MKRLSWVLDTYELPDFDIYDKDTQSLSGQVPIDASSRPPDGTFFIGIVPDTSPDEKVLCYHVSEGEYVVISYNYSASKLLQNVITYAGDLYEEKKVIAYDGESFQYPNPDDVPIIKEDMTIS
jgi:hypothetical protein